MWRAPVLYEKDILWEGNSRILGRTSLQLSEGNMKKKKFYSYLQSEYKIQIWPWYVEVVIILLTNYEQKSIRLEEDFVYN